MIVNGWFDWADRSIPGASNKTYLAVNRLEGIVCHSAEGYLPFLLWDVQDPGSIHSWTGSISFDGTLYQHYPVTASAWANGSKEANIRYIDFESEGIAGKPLNKAQQDTVLRIFSDFRDYTGRPIVRNETIWEHNEVATLWSPNNGPTSCPSHRYDTVFSRIKELGGEVPMTPEEKAEFEALQARVKAINDAVVERGRLHQLADDPDYGITEKLMKYARKEGII